MTDMALLIGRMDHWLASNRPEYYSLLQRGATDSELDAFETRLSLKLPHAFRQLYRWRNGQDSGSFDPLQFNRTFSTLDDVASAKEELDGMIGFDFEDPKYWRRGWVPFLHNGAGSYLCLDLDAEDGGQSGQIIAFWKSDQDRPIKYPCVQAWLASLVTSMENGTLELS